jgi:hypothetical protein
VGPIDWHAPLGPLTLWIRSRPVQGVLHGSLQSRQVFDDSVPNCCQVDSLIRVPELVSDTPNITPRDPRTKPFRFVPKPDRGFADDLKLALNGGNRHSIRPECLEIHAGGELVD